MLSASLHRGVGSTTHPGRSLYDQSSQGELLPVVEVQQGPCIKT
jgi:hypothetical protein